MECIVLGVYDWKRVSRTATYLGDLAKETLHRIKGSPFAEVISVVVIVATLTVFACQ